MDPISRRQRDSAPHSSTRGTANNATDHNATDRLNASSFGAVLRDADQWTLLPLLMLATLTLGVLSRRGRVEYPIEPATTVTAGSYHPRIAVNVCDWPELCLLPRINRTLARRIVEDRRVNGPYCVPDDLRRVAGIGPKTGASLASRLDFSCPWPLAGEGDMKAARPLE